MKLSNRSEYACLALIELTRRKDDGWIRAEDIAGAWHMPKKFLEQILNNLKRGGYVRSRRGVDGGYALARPPETISVAEVLRLMDGPLAPVTSVSEYFYASTPIEQSAPLVRLFREIRDEIARRLERTTFADLI